MSVVNGKDVILSFAKGAAFNPVACNATCALRIERETIETTFRDSTDIRSYIPGKAIITLEGSGPIEYAAGYTASDVMDSIFAGLTVNWEFTLTDNKGHAPVVKVYNGKGFFTTCVLTGDVQQAATCDYSVQVSGDIAGTSTPGSQPPYLRVWQYDAVGGESSLFDATLINCDFLFVFRNGIALEVIESGTPTPNQVLVNATAGTISFSADLPLGAGEYIQVLYEA